MAILYVESVEIERVWLPGKLLGLGGTSFPNTVLICTRPSVTKVLAVRVTALLIKFPELGVPNMIALPITSAMTLPTI